MSAATLKDFNVKHFKSQNFPLFYLNIKFMLSDLDYYVSCHRTSNCIEFFKNRSKAPLMLFTELFVYLEQNKNAPF